MPYSSYDHDKLETAETMRIERRIYFEAKDGEIAPYVSLPLEQLHAMREESAAAEQAIFNDLSTRAAAWEQQAGKTLLLDKAIEYTRTTVVQHTSNEWQKGEYDRYTRSNRVYQMNYHIYENTRYDREKQQSVPYSYSLTWGVYTNSPNRNGQAKIAGQDRKVFSDKAAMEKYLNGRIKAYDRLFTEISPPIPQEYAEHFKVNGMLLPGYTIEGEEPPQQQPQAAAIPETTGQQKEREHMSEQFSIMIGNRSRFEAGDPGGYWLDMPATKEQLHEAMQSVGITADNPAYTCIMEDKIMNITVYLGANEGREPALKTAVRELGAWIGEHGHTLVYGGSRVGLMGAVAESALAAGGKVIGVEPRFFIEQELQLDGLTELIVTEDMTDRKTKMIELGDAFIAFPGGTGTLEEIAEVMSKLALNQLDAPCIFYNLNGYYDHMKALLDHMIEMELSTKERQKKIYFANTLEEVAALLN